MLVAPSEGNGKKRQASTPANTPRTMTRTATSRADLKTGKPAGCVGHHNLRPTPNPCSVSPPTRPAPPTVETWRHSMPGSEPACPIAPLPMSTPRAIGGCRSTTSRMSVTLCPDSIRSSSRVRRRGSEPFAASSRPPPNMGSPRSGSSRASCARPAAQIPPTCPREPSPLLLSDIEGSTKLVQDLGEDYPTVLEQVRGIIREDSRSSRWI